eukprot:GHVN01097342.1.p2 GENE.GHVN01097342.1~~GHVN01097342.1.p2  ORF type:complete len:123 (+),score=21.83 GHVN01097342.1:653-1021(+)
MKTQMTPSNTYPGRWSTSLFSPKCLTSTDCMDEAHKMEEKNCACREEKLKFWRHKCEQLRGASNLRWAQQPQTKASIAGKVNVEAWNDMLKSTSHPDQGHPDEFYQRPPPVGIAPTSLVIKE